MTVETQTKNNGMNNGDITLFFRYMALFEKDMLTPMGDNYSKVFLPLQWREKVEDETTRKSLKEFYAKGAPGLYECIVARTNHYDALVLELLKTQPFAQFVIMGAGFDSRPYRFEKLLKEKNITVFELDKPPLQSLKLERLKQHFGEKAGMPDYVHYLPVDFNTARLPGEMKEAGYDETKLTLFLWEGVTCYLQPEGVSETLSFVQTHSAPGSMLLFDYVPREFLDGRYTDCYGASECLASMKETGQKFSFGIDRVNLETYLMKFNMQLLKHWTSRELGEEHLRMQGGGTLGPVAGYMNFAVAINRRP